MAGHLPLMRASSHAQLALLVDRDVDTRKMYSQFLQLGSWHIEEADDGREALAKAISRQPDVIVTDIRLPGMTGLELCAELRHDTATCTTPIIVVTGDAFDEERDRARQAGADSVLFKPCLPETLLVEMKRLLAAAPGRRSPAAIARALLTEPLTRLRQSLEPGPVPGRRVNLKQAHMRHDTVTPPVAPPPLVCPTCDRPLAYLRSHIGGVSERHQEQWDYFECPGRCGTFQYRVRTRKLRKV